MTRRGEESPRGDGAPLDEGGQDLEGHIKRTASSYHDGGAATSSSSATAGPAGADTIAANAPQPEDMECEKDDAEL